MNFRDVRRVCGTKKDMDWCVPLHHTIGVYRLCRTADCCPVLAWHKAQAKARKAMEVKG